jgi:hypothetical protein
MNKCTDGKACLSITKYQLSIISVVLRPFNKIIRLLSSNYRQLIRKRKKLPARES